MWISLLGLFLDVFGAVLLIGGEINGSAAMVNYHATGQQPEAFRQKVVGFAWWKRWPLQLAGKFGSKKNMGQGMLEDSFPVRAWGIVLLIIGFLLQALGTVWR